MDGGQGQGPGQLSSVDVDVDADAEVDAGDVDEGCSDTLEDLLQSFHTCSHRHFCTPEGPNQVHTHVCAHTHMQVVSERAMEAQTIAWDDNDKDFLVCTSGAGAGTGSGAGSGRRKPVGNREAVRRYRAKKKAQTALLEQQLEEQRALNQQLMRRLYKQGVLEAEVVRLRTVLGDMKVKLESELRVSAIVPNSHFSTLGPELLLLPGSALDGHHPHSTAVPCAAANIPCSQLEPSMLGPRKEDGGVLSDAFCCSFLEPETQEEMLNHKSGRL